MSEGQSRYKIIEELNNRKIKARESLANMERQIDDHVYSTEATIQNDKDKVKEREGKYKKEHKDWTRTKEIELKVFQQDCARQVSEARRVVKQREDTYEENFQEWKNALQAKVNLTTKDLRRYQTVHKVKVEEKNKVITEIESSINDLKEISKESNKDAK